MVGRRRDGAASEAGRWLARAAEAARAARRALEGAQEPRWRAGALARCQGRARFDHAAARGQRAEGLERGRDGAREREA